jgi:hypothetical protein
MKTIMKASILSALLLALAVPQMSFADPVSGCTNGPNNPVDFGPPTGIVVYTAFTCNLYPASSPYTINLTSNMTYSDANGNASLNDNLVGPGYIVVINGNPFALTDDSSGLWNQSLWTTVLSWPGDQDARTASDSLTVYYSGFPSALTVQTFDENLWGSGPSVDPYFFVQTGSYPNPAVYDAGANTYNIYPTPEPSSLLLLGTGILGLAVVVFRKAKSSGVTLSM